MNKMRCNYTTEYYLAIKRNRLLTNGTTWMNLRCIVVGERRQAQKAAYCMIPLLLFQKRPNYTYNE